MYLLLGVRHKRTVREEAFQEDSPSQSTSTTNNSSLPVLIEQW